MRRNTPKSQQFNAPLAHLAIIMDGNGRWAQQKGLDRIEGHQAGAENIQKVVKSVSEHKIDYLTLYAFSTENWSRPDDEVDGIMALLGQAIEKETATLHSQNIQINHLGRIDRLSPELQSSIIHATNLTRSNTGLALNIAFDYGGRDEILQAVKKIIKAGVAPDHVDEILLRQYLYTSPFPDPDLIIRTGGEIRLSNFLIWQAAYSEYYFVPILWPDFNEEEITKAIEEFKRRKRRFGGVHYTGQEG